MTKICLNCRTDNRDTAKFCINCRGTDFSLTPGTQLDNGVYRIQKELGRGGFGAVYLAYDARLNRPWVVKQLLIPSQATLQEVTELKTTFQREADSLSKLNQPGNPHIPEIVTYFSDANGHYLVMKYIEGETLEKRLARSGGKVDWREAVRWTIAVVDALAYMHGRQPTPILHRDIKPANILVDTQQWVWLVDFGLSKAQPQVGGTVGMTQPMGTEGYAPPEQYRKGGAVPTSDIYALAATLYHLVTGDDPSNHPMAFSLMDHLPVALQPMVINAVSQNPQQRPSAAQFKNQLEQLLQPTNHYSGARPFTWADKTVSHNPMELARAADAKWEEAKQHLYKDGQFKQWFANNNNNSLVKETERICQRYQDQDEGLEAFLQLPDLNAALLSPTFSISRTTLQCSLSPNQERRESIIIRHQGRGCLVVDLRPQAAWVASDQPRLKLLPNQMATVTLNVQASKIPLMVPSQTKILVSGGAQKEEITVQAEIPRWRTLAYRVSPWADWMGLGGLIGLFGLGLLAWLLIWLASWPTWLLVGLSALVGGVILIGVVDSNHWLNFGFGALLGAGAGYLLFAVFLRGLANWMGSPLPFAQWGALLGLVGGAGWYHWQKPARWNWQGWLAVGVALIFTFTAILIRASQPPWYYYSIANSQFEARQWVQARHSYQTIYDKNPAYQDVYTQMLSSAYNASQECVAEERWRCAQEELAFLLQYAPNYQDAAQLYVTARAEPLYQEGVVHLEKESWAEAETAFGAVVLIEPAYKDTAVLLIIARAEPTYRDGLAHLSGENWQDAVTAFQTVAALDADYKDVQERLIEAQAEPHYLEGLEYLDQGQWQAAETSFGLVIDLDPAYKDASVRFTEAKVERHYRAGQTYLAVEQWAKAATEFAQVVAIDPDYKDAVDLLQMAQVEADYQAGKAYLEAGAWGDAVAAFDRVLGIAPNYKDVPVLRREALSQWKEGLYDLAVKYSEAGEWAEAAATFAQTRALDPNYLDVADRLAKSPLREAMMAFYEARWQAEDVMLRHTLHGHQQAVTAVAFSPTHTMLATADKSGTVILWDGATGVEQRRLPRQSTGITTLTFGQVCDAEASSCRLLLVIGNETGEVLVWDVQTAQIRYKLTRHDEAITAVAFQPQEHLLATADRSGVAFVWDAVTGEYQHALDIAESTAWSLSYTDQNVLAAATQGDSIRLFRHGQGLKSLWDHAQPVHHVLYNPDGSLLVSADAAGHIWLWPVPADFLVAPANAQFAHDELTVLEFSQLLDMVFLPTGKSLVLATDSGVILWRLGSSTRTSWKLTETAVSATSFSPFGWLLALGQDDGSVQIWAANTQE